MQDPQKSSNTLPKTIGEHILVGFGYLLIAIIMFYPLLQSATTRVPEISYGDAYLFLWNLWYAPYELFTLHSNLYNTMLLFWPIGANLGSDTLMPLAGIFTAPITNIANLAVTSNFLFFVGFTLTGLATYMLARYITGNKLASFIAGFIFSFAPIREVHAFGHLSIINMEFIPLFVLFFLLLLKERRQRYVLGCAVCLLLAMFTGDIQQGIYITVLVLLIVATYFITADKSVVTIKENKKWFRKDFALLFGEIFVVAFLIGSPFLVPILYSTFSGALGTNLNGPLTASLFWSTDVSALFTPSFMNGILSNFSTSILNPIYSNNLRYSEFERVGYIGYSVVLLAIVAIYVDFKKGTLRKSALFLIPALVLIWLALGPLLQFGGKIYYVPGPFLFYYYIPFLNQIREPSRLLFPAMLCIAVLAAMGFDRLSKAKSGKGIIGNNYLLFSIFMLALFVEYYGMPNTNIDNVTVSAIIPSSYYSIGSQSGNFSVMPLPAIAINGIASEQNVEAEMYYQSAFLKPIVGGYTSRVTQQQYFSFQKVPLANEAMCLDDGMGFANSSVVIENYTKLTMLLLKQYNTSFITVDKTEFSSGNLQLISSYLTTMYGEPFTQDNSTLVFKTSTPQLDYDNNTIISYPDAGTWISYQPMCAQLLWYGSANRSIGILDTQNNTNVSMHFSAIGYGSNQLRLYFNNSDTAIANFSLSTSNITSYAINLKLQQGLNYVYFSSLNDTQNTYLTFGLSNVIFVSRSQK